MNKKPYSNRLDGDKLSRRRAFLRSVAYGAGTALAAGSFWYRLSLHAQEENPERSAAEFITQPVQASIDRGLAYLAERQLENGSFGQTMYSRSVAICALGGMAFIASGSTPGRGPYGEKIERCVNYLLECTSDNGFISEPNSSIHGPMYGHGFAALFLAEAYGMSQNELLREKLSRAINLISNTQNQEGGWRYQPQRSEADISVTICQVMALRAARNAGLHVPNETIDRCIEYVKRCQNPDGGFAYILQGGSPSAFARSAAGVVALYSAGIYEGPEIEKGLAYLMESIPGGPAGGFHSRDNYFYGHYYAVQAMWHAGGDFWRRWYPAIRDELLNRQSQEGAWLDRPGPEYATAMACVILQIPNNLLPIFQR